MTIPSSPLDARSKNFGVHRAFRAECVPKPSDRASHEAAARFLAAFRMGASVDLEIGCGVGWHPIRYARENPTRTLVAIERTSEKFAKFRERLKRNSEIPNLIPAQADAIAWVTHFTTDAAFDRIFLLYPNPNAQNPQGRWIRMPFFGHLLKKLKPGGTIEFRTNCVDYVAEIRREAQKSWGLSIADENRFTREDVSPQEARTHFERKYLARGESCFLIRLTR